MFSIFYYEQARKSLQRIPQKWRERIIRAMSALRHDPYTGKKLRGDLMGFYSLRVWPYRILYCIHKQQLLIMVVDIGHRQGIY